MATEVTFRTRLVRTIVGERTLHALLVDQGGDVRDVSAPLTQDEATRVVRGDICGLTWLTETEVDAWLREQYWECWASTELG